MKDYYLRLTDLEINGLKNVKDGKLNFVNKRKAFKASVLGLYGQNGTGKTALIDALHILKLLLSGKSIPDEYCNYIMWIPERQISSIVSGFMFRKRKIMM